MTKKSSPVRPVVKSAVMNKAVIYARVSRVDQKLENQLPVLRGIANVRGFEIAEEYSEKLSGARPTRPEWERLLEDARRGKFKYLIVWAIDRIGRSMIGTINAINAFDALGVVVISQNEAWLDMQGPTRNFLIGVFAWVAEQERERMIERTNAGLATARANGKRLGKEPMKIDMDRLIKLRAAGMPIKKVAVEMGIGVATAYKALQSPDVPDSLKQRVNAVERVIEKEKKAIENALEQLTPGPRMRTRKVV